MIIEYWSQRRSARENHTLVSIV